MHVVKIYRSVLHIIDRIFGIVEIALFIQKFSNTISRGSGHGQHDEYHGDHQKAHKYLYDVSYQTDQLSCGEAYSRVVSAGHYGSGSEPGYEDHAQIHAKLHKRHVERHYLFSF